MNHMKQTAAVLALILALGTTVAMTSCDISEFGNDDQTLASTEKDEDTGKTDEGSADEGNTDVSDTSAVTTTDGNDTTPGTTETTPGGTGTDTTPGTSTPGTSTPGTSTPGTSTPDTSTPGIDDTTTAADRAFAAIRATASADAYAVDMTQTMNGTNAFYRIMATGLQSENAMLSNKANATNNQTGATSNMECYVQGDWCYVIVDGDSFRFQTTGLEGSSMMMSYNGYLWVESFLTPKADASIFENVTETSQEANGFKLRVITYTINEGNATRAFGHMFGESSGAPSIGKMQVTVTIDEATGYLQTYLVNFDLKASAETTVTVDLKMAFGSYGNATVTLPENCQEFTDRTPNTNSPSPENSPNAPEISNPNVGENQKPDDPGLDKNDQMSGDSSTDKDEQTSTRPNTDAYLGGSVNGSLAQDKIDKEEQEENREEVLPAETTAIADASNEAAPEAFVRPTA